MDDELAAEEAERAELEEAGLAEAEADEAALAAEAAEGAGLAAALEEFWWLIFLGL